MFLWQATKLTRILLEKGPKFEEHMKVIILIESERKFPLSLTVFDSRISMICWYLMPRTFPITFTIHSIEKIVIFSVWLFLYVYIDWLLFSVLFLHCSNKLAVDFPTSGGVFTHSRYFLSLRLIQLRRKFSDMWEEEEDLICCLEFGVKW
jgi:hypothetical protein